MSTSHSWPPSSSRPPSHPPGSYSSSSGNSRSHHPPPSSASSSSHHHSSRSASSGSHHHASSSSGTSSSHQQYHHEEDRLGRSWRTLASSVVMSTQKAEKAASVQEPPRELLKDLNDAVVTFLRARMEWGRQISYIEAKLQGKAQENETMDCYLRCQPRLGRKRKRQEEAAVAAAVQQASNEQDTIAVDDSLLNLDGDSTIPTA